jgi:hypothetical protein
VPEKEPIWNGFDPCFIEDPVGFDLLIVGEHPAIPILVPGSVELPTASSGQNLHQAKQLLASEVHANSFTRSKWASQELVIRFGPFGVSWNWYWVRFDAARCNFSTECQFPTKRDKGSPMKLLY